MSDLILPWPARHPALLDSAGAPVLFVAPAAVHADQPGMQRECPTQQPTAPATEPPHRTAHLVTPSAVLRQLLRRCLLALDLTVTETGDPDLIVLDLAAPDALAHCRTWRDQHPDLPIIALTPLVTDHLLAWEVGANAVLPIPFDVGDLQATIRILLGDHDA